MRAFRLWITGVLFCMAAANSCLATPSAPGPWKRIPPAREINLWNTFESDSKYVPVAHSMSVSTCEVSIPPEPLATPVPLVDASGANKVLSVSFVIGADGMVHSALLWKSLGNKSDRAILNVVRSWRYRPALCNGVPTEMEATVDFSNRQSDFGLE